MDGAVTVQGTAKGPTDNVAVTAALSGQIGSKGVPKGPVQVALNATGLPANPAGAITAQGTLEGAPLNLAITADRDAAGTLHATIGRADWKSLHAEGAVTLTKGATLPQGKVSLRMTRLDDLRALAGQAVSGALSAEASFEAGVATVDLDATRAGIPGSAVGHAVLKARVTDPTTHPTVAATLDAEGIEAAGIGGSAKISVQGPQEALAIRLNAALSVSGAPAAIATTATLNVPGKTVQLAALTADYKGEAVRLLAPARVSFGDGVAVDRVRIGLQQAVLEVAGRVTPALNLTASLRGVTPDLAKPFAHHAGRGGRDQRRSEAHRHARRPGRHGSADRERPAVAQRAGARPAARHDNRDRATGRQGGDDRRAADGRAIQPRRARPGSLGCRRAGVAGNGRRGPGAARPHPGAAGPPRPWPGGAERQHRRHHGGPPGQRHADPGRRRGAGPRPRRARQRHRRHHPGHRPDRPDRKLQRPGRPGHDHRQRHRRAHRGDACRRHARDAPGTAARQ